MSISGTSQERDQEQEQDMCDSPLASALQLMKKQLEQFQAQMETRLAIQERHITELHGFLSQHQPTGQFPQFRRLPPEIRQMIWDLALPCRKLRPTRFFKFWSEDLECQSFAPPTVAHACREARRVARRNGGLYCQNTTYANSWTWFDGSRDILDLSIFFRRAKRLYSDLIMLAEDSDTVILSTKHLEERWMSHLFGRDVFHQRVQTIYLQIKSPLKVEKVWWHPHLVSEMFDGDTFTIVDMEDPKRVEWLRKVLFQNMNHNISFGLRTPYRRSCQDLARITDQLPDLAKYQQAKQSIMSAWLTFGGESPLPAECLDEDGLISEEKVRSSESFSKMPRVRLAISLELRRRLQKKRQWEDDASIESDSGLGDGRAYESESESELVEDANVDGEFDDPFESDSDVEDNEITVSDLGEETRG
ncbi:hypothetical protein PT974_01204 [Cladobotryum mycophilum]|uniref:2EXR domain-containing protein n=1 Tax=Cladobotryum mycophilum TaxID=491253 RepID=A0ABR0T4G3_9HYPO